MYEYRAQLKKVVDGDTVDLKVDLGFNTKVKARFRLADINAPETRTKDKEEKAAGMKAKEWLEAFFEDERNETVLIETQKDSKGKYGRWICTIYGFHGPTGTLQNINKSMVNKGLAKFQDY